MPIPWTHLEQKYSSTKNRHNETHGIIMVSKAGTLDLAWNTIDVCDATTLKQGKMLTQTHSSYFPMSHHSKHTKPRSIILDVDNRTTLETADLCQLPRVQQPTMKKPIDNYIQFLRVPPCSPPQYPHALPRVIPWVPFSCICSGAPTGIMHHPTWVAQHLFDDHGKRQTIDDLLKGPMKVCGIEPLAMN